MKKIQELLEGAIFVKNITHKAKCRPLSFRNGNLVRTFPLPPFIIPTSKIIIMSKMIFLTLKLIYKSLILLFLKH